MKNLKFALVALVILAAGASLYFLFSKKDTPAPENTQGNSLPPSDETTSLGMYAEENAVVPYDQKPGNSVTLNSILLDKPGFVVIHEDLNGEPGDILGSSSLYQKGEFTKVEVQLSRETKNNETLYAMLHQDSDSNGAFDPVSDKPVKSKLGGAIMASFVIDAKAEDNPPVSIP